MLWTQNYYSCGNKTVAKATIIKLWAQIRKCYGNEKVEEAKINILRMPKYILCVFRNKNDALFDDTYALQ